MRRAWDADGLMGRDPLWGRFWELPQIDRSTQDLLVRVRDGLHSALREYGTDRRIFSLIHADLHADNVLVSGERMHVIDFDDAGFGWHMYELAVALFGAQRPDLPTLVDAVAGGYREVRPLSDGSVRSQTTSCSDEADPQEMAAYAVLSSPTSERQRARKSRRCSASGT